MTTIPPVHVTAEDMLVEMRERLNYARAELKQAELRGYSPEIALGRVFTLAGLLGTFDPTLKESTADFVRRMADVSDVPEYYIPEGK